MGSAEFGVREDGLAVPAHIIGSRAVEEVWADEKRKLIVTLHGAMRVRQSVKRRIVLPWGVVEARRNDAQTVMEIEREDGQDAEIRPRAYRLAFQQVED